MLSSRIFQNKILSILGFLLIIYTLYALLPLFSTIWNFISIVLYPFLLSLIFYYLMRPIVHYFHRRFSIYTSIFFAFCILLGFLVLTGSLLFPVFAKQIALLLNFLKNNMGDITAPQPNRPNTYFNVLMNELKQSLTYYLTSLEGLLVKNWTASINMVTEFFTILIVVPFVLFYMLKDDKDIIEETLVGVPEKYRKNLSFYFSEVDDMLVSYINGRLIISLAISAPLFLCFLAIGLDYSLLLFLFCIAFLIIPTLGIFIASVPVIVIGFSMNTFTGIEAMVLMTLAGMVEGFIITPKVLGKSLDMHPLTVMMVLLASGYLFGMFGLIFAIPAFLFLKLTVKHLRLFDEEFNISDI